MTVDYTRSIVDRFHLHQNILCCRKQNKNLQFSFSGAIRRHICVVLVLP